MGHNISEADWKVFRQIHQIAVERFSQQVLEEVQLIVSDASITAHERYGILYGLMGRRNKEMARAFDDFRRSTALEQLGLIKRLGVLTEEELSMFSPDAQRVIRVWAGEQ